MRHRAAVTGAQRNGGLRSSPSPVASRYAPRRSRPAHGAPTLTHAARLHLANFKQRTTMAEPSGWTLDLTGDGAPVATDIYDAAPLPYCGKPGFCSEHLHVMADHTPVGPVVISLPREAVEGPDYSDMQLAPIYTAAVFHARVRARPMPRRPPCCGGGGGSLDPRAPSVGARFHPGPLHSAAAHVCRPQAAEPQGRGAGHPRRGDGAAGPGRRPVARRQPEQLHRRGRPARVRQPGSARAQLFGAPRA